MEQTGTSSSPSGYLHERIILHLGECCFLAVIDRLNPPSRILILTRMNITPRSVSIRISPGKRPNQLKAQGANCSITPATSNTAPAIMIHFAMFSLLVRYLIPSKFINHHELVDMSRLGSYITRRSCPPPYTHTFGQQLPFPGEMRTVKMQQN